MHWVCRYCSKMSRLLLTYLRLMLTRRELDLHSHMQLSGLVLVAPVAARQPAARRGQWTPAPPTRPPHRRLARPAHATTHDCQAEQAAMEAEEGCEGPRESAQGSRRTLNSKVRGCRRTGALRPSRAASSTGARAAHCARAPSSAVSAAESAAVSCRATVCTVTNAGRTGLEFICGCTAWP